MIMTDYILNYPNQNAAKAGPIASKYGYVEDKVFTWKADRVVEVKIWKPSEDTLDEDENVVHNYLSGVWLLVSSDADDTVADNSSSREFTLNRIWGKNKACLKSKKAGAIDSNDFKFEPVFSGMDVPFGSLE